MAERSTEPFVIVRDLCVDYEVRGGQQRAVDHVNFQVNEGETLALVGESGSGKSSVAKAILRLVAHSGGSVTVGGTNIFTLARGRLRAFRRTMQMVFQDAGGSLTPFMTIAALLEDTLRCHGLWKSQAGEGQLGELLANVGLAAELAERYPRELSGGQRQRVALARCLAPGPALVVLDEPLSALDVPAQADLLAMLVGLQTSRRLTTLLITHHLEAARVLAHSVAVMCAGRVVETGPPSEVLAQPRHAYTQRLVASVPRLEPLRRTTAAPFHKPG